MNGNPTRYADLNEVLHELVDRVSTALGPNIVGAYLVGSFALGAGDRDSDVDFLVVTEEHMTPDQEQAVRTIHRQLPDQDVIWAQHLEGSYPPRDELGTIAALGRAWLYVDNGSREMERSTHCNTALNRWMLRERGVTLDGDDPHTLVDEVGADDLRREVPVLAAEYRAWLDSDPTLLDNGWRQPYTVITFSRMMATLSLGEVVTKSAALQWALDNLDPEWARLLRQARDDRPEPYVRYWRSASPGTIEPTRRFVDYSVARIARSNW